MPKVSIYVPDDMYTQIRDRELSMSRIAQRAFAEALAADDNASWIAAARERPLRTTATSTEDLMSATREEFGA